ncbi:MAG: hypothetical protein AAGU27_03260 [Dehalobacterium sp.]
MSARTKICSLSSETAFWLTRRRFIEFFGGCLPVLHHRKLYLKLESNLKDRGYGSAKGLVTPFLSNIFFVNEPRQCAVFFIGEM